MSSRSPRARLHIEVVERDSDSPGRLVDWSKEKFDLHAGSGGSGLKDPDPKIAATINLVKDQDGQSFQSEFNLPRSTLGLCALTSVAHLFVAILGSVAFLRARDLRVAGEDGAFVCLAGLM